MIDWKQTVKEMILRGYFAETKVMRFEKPCDEMKPFCLLLTANVQSAYTMALPM